jgi:hypothetical protein
MDPVIHLGKKRELFVDSYMIDSLDNLEHVLHRPALAGDPDKPLEGGYVTILKDGDSYKRYYRIDTGSGAYDGHPGEITCMDVSNDGIHWEKPNLGIFPEIEGHTNIIWTNDAPRSHNFSPFIDNNPQAPRAQRFKALSGTHKDDGGRPDTVPPLAESDSGLYAFSSPDGIHWTKMASHPVLTFPQYAFDSQNVTFWSESEQCYVCFFRCWEPNTTLENPPGTDTKISSKTHLRSIARSTSTDYINWTEPVRLKPNFLGENLYTSQAHPYYRAPQVYISLATRFIPARGSSTDIMFMSIRSGKERFDRTFKGAFVTPGPDPLAWGNRSNYANLNTYQTSETEISFYVRGIRRVLRIDGFASVRSCSEPGVLITKPFTFDGNTLSMNYATSAAGSLRVSFLDAEGKPIAGFSEQDSIEVIGDMIDGIIPFPQSTPIHSLAGKVVRMKVRLTEADLYSFAFIT